MKRYVVWLLPIALAALALSWLVTPAFGEPKGDAITVKGEIVDLWCYMDHGARGADHKSCGVACAQAGNPIGIVDDNGNVYVLMGLAKHQPAKDLLVDKMAETISLDGTLVKKGGIQVIYVSAVK